MKLGLAALALTLCAQVAAEEMYKCRDASGRITYSGKECKQIGLTSAGEIKGRITVQPALKTPPAPPAPPPAAAAKDDAAKDAAPSGKDGTGSAEGSATPERRCFTTKTAKGTATRCNDVPE